MLKRAIFLYFSQIGTMVYFWRDFFCKIEHTFFLHDHRKLRRSCPFPRNCLVSKYVSLQSDLSTLESSMPHTYRNLGQILDQGISFLATTSQSLMENYLGSRKLVQLLQPHLNFQINFFPLSCLIAFQHLCSNLTSKRILKLLFQCKTLSPRDSQSAQREWAGRRANDFS